ncbi:VWA domain-containing protein [Amylibacter sp. SFDW26]|uniref:vWA domain-containing protein n=1 Tax=Amylibacter sp. SFDW26 TaxID=2652722 RepID=UPI0012617F38|nr:VWA domain-containing protein [Amylibacter sp. SFDW26]KAB7615985.1 VWA domain-containing protein [Amylibacter sp. SFDW26]
MTITALNTEGRLAQNIIYFCRALRRAEVPVGTAQVNDAIRAIQTIGFTKREDFFVVLQACLINRVEHLQIFQQVFNMFWRDPEVLESMIQNMLPMLQTVEEPKKLKAAETRASDAVSGGNDHIDQRPVEEQLTLDAQFTISKNERLNSLDFEQMTNAEIKEAERAIADMHLQTPKQTSRRFMAASYGTKIDARAVLREARRTGGEVLKLPKRRPRSKVPNLVILTDISGSMSTYSRMMMHFIYSMAFKHGKGWAQVHAFTFGTRLSNITKSLTLKDPDAALKAIGQDVQDWDGGTKIGESLERFNKDWSRRVLGTDAVVLIVTDGLERGEPDILKAQIKRLRLSCRHLIWLNPLLRYDQFEPQAAGIRTMLPFVDEFVACHSLKSMRDLTNVLSDAKHTGLKQKMMAVL